MCTTNLSFVNRHRAAGGVAAERCIFLPYPEPAFELWAGIMERSDAEGGGLTGYLEFEAEKYGGGRAEAIVRRLQAVLARAAAAPGDLPLEELDADPDEGPGDDESREEGPPSPSDDKGEQDSGSGSSQPANDIWSGFAEAVGAHPDRIIGLWVPRGCPCPPWALGRVNHKP